MDSEILRIRSRIINGESSARAEVENSLKTFRENEKLHALLEIFPEYSLEKADAIDAQIREIREKTLTENGVKNLAEFIKNFAEKLAENDEKSQEIFAKIEREVVAKIGRLAGVPYVAKDNFLTTVGHTTAAAKILENFASPIDATAVEKLNNEGAILIGKSNLDAFAHGGSTENSAFGATRNAVDFARVAGGSSGGSAVVVAKNIVPFALGSDTGGSIREPASFNGVVGYKPTYGMISRYGVVAMASSTDVVGTFSRSVADAEILCDILSGKDGRDGTLHDKYFEIADKNLREKVDLISRKNPENSAPRKLKIGLIRDFLGEGVDDDVRAKTLDFAQKLRDAGHDVTEVDLPMAKYSLAIYYIVVPAELSSNLARYDGVRYGVRAGEKIAKISDDRNRFATADSEILTSEKTGEHTEGEAEGALRDRSGGETSPAKNSVRTLDEIYENSRSAGFMTENKRRLLIGAFVLSSGYFDAYYLQAQKARTLLIREFDKLFANYDFLVGPVAPTPAFKLGENVADPLKMYLSDVMTTPASLAGLPAISLPWGESRDGLPIGVQIIGRQKDDAGVLEFAKSVEAGSM